MPGDLLRISEREYVEDRGRTSGSVLGWVEREPERYAAWLRGENVSGGSAATGRGSFVHAKLLEPDNIKGRFAFYPNRYETMVPKMVPKIGAKGQPLKEKVPCPDGTMVRQDDDERTAIYKPMLRVGDYAQQLERDWLAAHRGMTIVYPETMPAIAAMLRAVANHRPKRGPSASELLDGCEPEITGHYTCPITGEPMRIRPDLLKPRHRYWGEIKTLEPKNGRRLDPSDPVQVRGFLRDGFHRKSALLHDGLRTISGDNWTGYWILIEATEDDPRVCVIEDPCDSFLAELGRNGDGPDGEHKGYPELTWRAQAMRESGDFRHHTVQEVGGWQLPEVLINRMRFAQESQGNGGGDEDHFVPPILGATPMEAYDGR